LAVKPKFHLAHHVFTLLDTFDVLSPCILAVPSLSNSVARHDELDRLDTSNVSSRVETWRDEPSGIWASVSRGMGVAYCSASIKQRLSAGSVLNTVTQRWHKAEVFTCYVN